MSAATPIIPLHAPLLTEHDVYLLREGTHDRLYEKLGAQVCDVGDVQGVRFRRLGAECRRSVRGRRLQRLG